MLHKDEFFRVLFNTIPAHVLIVDENCLVQAINTATENLFGVKSEQVALKQGGQIFQCVFLHPEGCGYSENCKTCVMRGTAMAAIAGKSISRSKGKLVIRQGNEIKELNLMVSSAPVHYEQKTYAIVVVEDVSVITELEGLLPICCSCKKIRDDSGYWSSVEKYIQAHSEAEFTHGYCPDCLAKLYPQYAMKMPTETKCR